VDNRLRARKGIECSFVIGYNEIGFYYREEASYMENRNTKDCIGLIPAAGKGLRLGLPYPKELYPIIRNNRYKPVSQFVVDNLLAAHVKHLIFVVNETKGQILGYFGSGRRLNCSISYVVQELTDNSIRSTSPGLANALDSAYHLTTGKTVFFGMADTVMQPVDVFLRAYAFMQPSDDAVLCLFPTDTPEKFGMVRCLGDRVLEIIDKPTETDLTFMWGCIIWSYRFTEYLHACVNVHGMTDFARIMNQAIQAGHQFRGIYLNDGNYIDLGTYEEIMELDRRLRD
jgi:glucose-1-phosphate thymidylyltransferase